MVSHHGYNERALAVVESITFRLIGNEITSLDEILRNDNLKYHLLR